MDALDILPGDCDTPISFSLIIILKALFQPSVCEENFHALSYGPSSQYCAGDLAGKGLYG